MTSGELRDARTGREDELLELVHPLRKALEANGERLPPDWTEEAIADLRAGRLAGWFRPAGADGGELGFYSKRPPQVYAHVHVLPGPGARERGRRMMERLASDPPARALRLRMGVSGIDEVEESALAEEWALRPHRSVTTRFGLERSLQTEDLLAEEPTPPGATSVAAESIRPEALADLDRRAFYGSVDAELFAGDGAENLRVVQRILDGGLGRFLGEASAGVVDGDGRLGGFVLAVELSPRVALIADLAVDPAIRRQGWGRHLLRWSLRALRALGHERVRLWVTEGNREARSLYGRFGFEPYARTVIFSQAPDPAQPHAAA